ncbi:MAG: hypothetical protein M3P51_10015 [Chloroflexota bacterium]|nr:hypothetical protein [Chloroflexota bacterium]
MKRLVEFPTESGDVILVEVEEAPRAGGARRGLSPSDSMERARTSFEEALDKARPIAAGVFSKLRSLDNPPDEIQVEFGISLSAEAGAVLASASTSSNYSVTLTWRKATDS